MQAKLGAGFLTVAVLFIVVGQVIAPLPLTPAFHITLLAASYVTISLGAAWVLSYVVARRLRGLADAASEIAKGDLTVRLDTEGDDESADLARSLSGMTTGLLTLVREVQGTAERIHASACSLSGTSGEINVSTAEIATTTRDIARGVEAQASQVLETGETTRDLSRSVERVASRARDVYQAASAAADRAARGAADARRATEGIEDLATSTASAAAAVEGFRLQASEIGNIVNSITSISHQTHLLAINAAIEAARAGAEGRGFSVVAEEVGRLADDVRRFAEQISSISEQILRGSRAVADEFRKSVASGEQLRAVVDRSATSFEGILTAIRATASRVGEISELASNQKDAATEVAGSLERIARIAEQNARGTDEASRATQEQMRSMQRMAESARMLAGTSVRLNDLVAVFKVPH